MSGYPETRLSITESGKVRPEKCKARKKGAQRRLRTCLVITHEKAALSTDGRYFNQAEKQLDSNWELLKQGIQDVPTIQEWTADQAEGGKVVGVDPSVVTAADARKLAEKIKKKGGEYKAIDDNLVDLVWGDQRPARPSEKVITQPEKYSGKSFEDKIEDLRKELEKKKSLGFVVSMLDEVAWLFNLRGSEYVLCPHIRMHC
ncbi:putative Xaa-Pro aminopeptidase P [Alternaria alternata]|nr:putative Xaa-Pro aminopeptidase P [Alternaria alternata]